jgi:hypothetical protein
MKEHLKESIHQLKDMLHQNHWMLWVIIILCLWDGIWKMISIWKAARNNELGWFIVLAILNTVGILPIIYILLIDKKSLPKAH